MGTQLRTLVKEAATLFESDVCEKNYDELFAVLRPILVAAGHYVPLYFDVTWISIGIDQSVYISIEYYEHGCGDSSEYTIPAFIIDADDVMHAAKISRIDRDIEATIRAVNDEHNAIAHAERRLKLYQEKLRKLTNDRQEMTGIL